MKSILVLSVILMGQSLWASDLSLYKDLSLKCSAENLVITGSRKSVEKDNKTFSMSFQTQNTLLSITPYISSSWVSTEKEIQTEVKDAFNFKYRFTLPFAKLTNGNSFTTKVVKIHESANIEEILDLTCEYSFAVEEIVYLPATKKNLKKLSALELAYVAEMYPAEDELDLNQKEEAQLRHYRYNVQLKSDGLRSSYQKYVKRIAKHYQEMYDDCVESRDPEDFDGDYSYCKYDVQVMLDVDGAFVAGVISFADENGTDDGDDDWGYFALFDWSGEALYEVEWNNW